MTTTTTTQPNPGRDLRPGLVRDALGLDALLDATAPAPRDALKEGH